MRQRLHRAATIAAVLIVFGSSGAIAGRGGFRGGSMGGFRGGSMGGFRGGSMSEFHGGSMGGFRGGSMSEFHGGSASGFHAGGASSFGTSHSYGGYGGASGAGRSPYGGSSSAGYRGGSFDTARGGTVNYGAAGRTATGPGGATAGRGAYGVSGTTAGGRSYGGVGRVGGAVGPGGNAVGGRSSFGMASGPNGMVAGGSRSGFVAGGSRGYGGGVWHGGGYGNYGGYNSRWMHGNWGGGYGGYGGYGGWGLGGIGLGVGLGLASWGLGSSLYSGGWGYMPYSNPYYVQAAGNFPQAAGYYDYSQPIDTTSADAPAAVAEPAMSAFDQARAAFLAGDYPQALSLVDQAIKGTPNNSAAHEFRGVTLFALGRYDDAAGTLYGVLSVGPGWDWTTLISLYADVETYTAQLRALEQNVRDRPNVASTRFVLAYLYLTAGQNDPAIAELKRIVSLQPGDRVSTQLLQSLTKGQPDGTGPAPAQATVASAPSGRIAGTWTASPAPGSTITLKVADDGKFTWTAATKGQPHTLAGQSTLGDDVLTLVQDEGGAPMVGHLTWKDADDFTFQALGGGQGDPGLAFRRTP